VDVAAEETLLLYTDGVTDTRGPDERFGKERLREFLIEHAGFSPAEMLVSLDGQLERFQAIGHADDTGALALRPVPADADAARRLTNVSGRAG
jgi:phosphoserine phosphatase RsbU/P